MMGNPWYDLPDPRKTLIFYAVFFGPEDFPTKWVVRPQWPIVTATGAPNVAFAQYAIVAETYEEVIKWVPPGLYRLPHQKGDPPFLVETWF